jgi:eukaryotic-like serine/threonine-protein kinase
VVTTVSGDSGEVAHYRLLERIGEGALGEVYRARDTKVGRTVALKFAAAGLAGGQRYQRLLEDARAAAALSHPHIATLFDVGHHDGRLYLAYEFLQGETLGHKLAGGLMNSRHALDLAVQMADALAEGHAHGVLHKALRPEVVVETTRGSVKVLEFGLSLWTHAGQTLALAAAAPDSVPADARSVVAYMSPEQALGGRVDGRTDLFSLGVILYEMLTGGNPFVAEGTTETILRVMHRVPPPPSSVNPALPRSVDVLLGRLLARDLATRASDAATIAAELRRCRAQMDEAMTDSVPGRPGTAAPAPELLPIEEERGGLGIWVLFGVLTAAVGAALYFWMR